MYAMKAPPTRPAPNRSAPVRRAVRAAVNVVTLLTAAALTTACAPGGDRQENRPPAGRLADDAPTSGIRVGTLPSQDLAPGDCGLFLWTRTDTPRLVFYASSAWQNARVVLEDRLVELPRTAAAGASYRGLFAQQTYLTMDREVSVNTEVEWGEDMENGRRATSAVVRIAHDSGWETLIPAAGLAGCLPEEG